MYAEVIVDIASEQVDRVFTYRVPDAFSGMLFQGSRVRVPFGFREKEGFVHNLMIRRVFLEFIISRYRGYLFQEGLL